MAVGDRIKLARNFRKMTMKELGLAVGFDENSADVRIAQYENNSRKPKEPLLRKLAEVLDVNYDSLCEPTPDHAAGIMQWLLALDDHKPGMHLVETIDNSDPEFPEKRVGICFDYTLLDDFLKEWMLRKQQLQNKEITSEEYQEWKLNWPYTADDCGKTKASKEWRKKEE